MNAQLKSQTAELNIDQIDLDVPNDRHDVDKTQLQELADSIKVQGLINPITVFEKPRGKDEYGRFTLGCGHRRLAAHKLLKLTTIRADIRPPASIAEIRAARAIENLQRADLTPLEESEALEALVETHAGDAKRAAEAIGRPLRWVENRLALARLSPRVKQLLLDGLLTLGHAQLIARLPNHQKQEQIAGYVKGSKRKFGGKTVVDEPPASLSDCRDLVEGEQRDVSKVPWRTDVEFAGKPACDVCPMRTGNCKGLFDNPADDNPNICLDAECYQEKATLASRAVRKAGHTIAKEDLPKSEAGLEKAIEIRGKDDDVSFVKPAAAIAAAREAVENGIGKPSKKPKTPSTSQITNAEKKGELERKIDQEAWKLYHAEDNARDAFLTKAVNTVLSDIALRHMMLMMITYHSGWANCSLKRAKPVSSSEIGELLRLMKAPTVQLLEKVGKAVIESWGEKPPMEMFDDSCAIEYDQLELIAAAFDTQIPPKPLQKNLIKLARAKFADEIKAAADKKSLEGDKAKAAKKAAQAAKTKPKTKKK